MQGGGVKYFLGEIDWEPNGSSTIGTFTRESKQ